MIFVWALAIVVATWAMGFVAMTAYAYHCDVPGPKTCRGNIWFSMMVGAIWPLTLVACWWGC